MKDWFKKLWENITYPFIAIGCIIGTSQEINEDGSWDKYWEKKNKRLEKRK